MNILNNRKSVIYKHRYCIFFFFYLIIYHVLIVNHLQSLRLNDVTFSVFCLDYSFGFASKILPGAIFHLLFGSHASKSTATVYAIVLIFLFFLALSFLLEKFVERVSNKYKTVALVLVVLFLSGAYTFSIFTKWVGILDSNWLYITLFFVVCLEHVKLRYVIPILFVLALLIHFSALLFILPIFVILMLYRLSVCTEKKEKKQIGIIMVCSIVIALAFFLFLLLFESKMICPIDEFHEKLRQNGTTYYIYTDYSFFRVVFGEPMLPEEINQIPSLFSKFFYYFYYQIKTVFNFIAQDVKYAVSSVLINTLLITPAAVLLLRFFIKRFKQHTNKLLRICALLTVIHFIIIVIMAFLLSIPADMTRYLTYGFLSIFIATLFTLYHEQQAQEELFDKMEELKQSLPWKIYALAYVFITFPPSK